MSEPAPTSPWPLVVGLALTGALAVWSATAGVGAYGWAIFTAIPFFIGLIVSLCMDDEMGFYRRLAWAYVVVALIGVLLTLGRLEGLICIAMTIPLAGPIVLGGVVAGVLLRRVRPRFQRENRFTAIALALLVMPGGLAVDASRTASAPRHAVVTAVEIDAPPERVWPHVVSFAELPPPTEWIFKAGVAHPLRARIEGQGVGTVRYCEFSTGAFVEPITVWDAPRRLAFSVTTSPSPLSELNPFGAVHAAHLDGYLASERGEFRLEPLPGGRTRLVGTTWYRHHMYPDRYWQAWSDFVIHRIHRRVLTHIAARAEAPQHGAP